MQRDRKKGELSPVLKLAKPKQRTRFKVRIVEGIAIIEGENGAVAVIPEDEVCRLAERLNLILEGYQC